MADVTSPRAAAQAHLAQLPLWSGTPEFTPIEDGRTNCNFRVTDAKGTWFARVGVDLPHHFIFREHERRAALLASDLGVAPRIVYAEDGALVTEFIEGRGLTIADGQNEATLIRIAEVLRRLHQAKPEPIGHVFDLTRILPAYLAMLGQGTLEKDDARRLDAIIKAIPPLPPSSLAHSDLIPNNFIDDGEKLWIIDWEYAGRGHPAIDLAMIVSNFDLPEPLARLVTEAHGLCAFEEVSGMTPALIARELLWTLVQIGKAGLTGDLPEYRELCLTRLRDCSL